MHEATSGAANFSPSSVKTDTNIFPMHSRAMAQFAQGTSVVIASLLAIPDGVALIPNATSLIGWILSIIGIWLSAAVLWFVGFLGILHCVRLLVRGVEVGEAGVRLWRLARPIAWENIEAVAIEPQMLFSRIFSLKPPALRLTIFERKKSWRKDKEPHLVPHHIPSFLFSPEEFSSLFTAIGVKKFGTSATAQDVVLTEPAAYPRLKAVYKLLGWQRVALSILISLGLVMFLTRKAIVHYQYNAGNKAMAACNFADAKSRYAASAAADPTFAAAWNNLANAEFQLSDFSAAEKHWKLALRYKPDFVEAKISLAYLYRQNREFGKSKDLITSALNLAPLNPYALLNRSDYEMRTGHVREAVDDARLVTTEDRRQASDAKFMAACLLAQGKNRLGDAREGLRILSDSAPVPDPTARTANNITFRLIVTSEIERSLNQLAQARAAVDYAVARAPKSSEVWLEKARVDTALGNFNDAEKSIEKARSLNSENPWVYLTEASLLLKSNPQDKQKIEEAIKQASSCSTQEADSLAETAKLLSAIGLIESSHDFARQALQNEPHQRLALQILAKH